MKNIGQIILFILLCYWSFVLFSSSNPWIFLDYANLMFHEAGHFIFMFFGEFIAFLGGTLLQISIPIGVFIYFFINQQYFSSLVVLFWIGDNLINIGNYMKDAIPMSLPLVIAGSTHDWNWLFSQLHLLSFSPIIGTFVCTFGYIFIVISLIMILITILRDFVSKDLQSQSVSSQLS